MIHLEREPGGVALLRLARPPVNALDLELVQAIERGVRAVGDSDARALVLTGDGSCFSAGIDTKLAPTYDAQQRRDSINAINQLVATICSASVPVLAAINGHAMGGGLVIALACDLRLAGRGEHRLALNEVSAGVPFPAGPLAVVRSELDPSVMRDLCLTGRAVGPDEALALRIVEAVLDPPELLDRARERALELASFPAYALVKAQVRGRLISELEQIAAADDPLIRRADRG